MSERGGGLQGNLEPDDLAVALDLLTPGVCKLLDEPQASTGGRLAGEVTQRRLRVRAIGDFDTNRGALMADAQDDLGAGVEHGVGHNLTDQQGDNFHNLAGIPRQRVFHKPTSPTRGLGVRRENDLNGRQKGHFQQLYR